MKVGCNVARICRTDMPAEYSDSADTVEVTANHRIGSRRDDFRAALASGDARRVGAIARRATRRGTGLPPSTDGASTVAAATATARERRPLLLGAAVFLDRFPSGARYCQARDRHRLASPRLPPVLDVEEPPTRRPAACSGRRPRVYSDHVAEQPPLGRSADSWRVAETGC